MPTIHTSDGRTLTWTGHNICFCAHCEQHGDYWHRAGKNNNELDGKLSAVRGAPTPDRPKPGKEAQQ